jgi:hypothetical protein
MDSASAPPPYSIPWQLRPAIAATAIRADTDFAAYEDRASRRGLTIASTVTMSYRIPGTGDVGQGSSTGPRRVDGAPVDLDDLRKGGVGTPVVDVRERPVLLLEGEWQLNLTAKYLPDYVLAETPHGV